MNIGVVGYGVVGGAITYGFRKLGHTVKVHDVKLGTSIDDVLDTALCYICVPTPSTSAGQCDTSIVEKVVEELVAANYSNPIVIKSTVPPGTTATLSKRYPENPIFYVPEFLRERCAVQDFTENHKLLVIGDTRKNFAGCISKIIDSHGHYPWKTIVFPSTEAEILKLAHNALAGLRVVFANEIYELCRRLSSEELVVNYDHVKSGLLSTTDLPDRYLDVSPQHRGYSSYCLNKDLPSLAHVMESLGLGYLKLFRTIIEDNQWFPRSPFPGTRE